MQVNAPAVDPKKMLQAAGGMGQSSPGFVTGNPNGSGYGPGPGINNGNGFGNISPSAGLLGPGGDRNLSANIQNGKLLFNHHI